VKYVLVQKYPPTAGPELAGKPCYFKNWCAIGPVATPRIEEAARFDSAQEAMRSPAFTHWASFYNPQEVPA
jgi:hypothetical protein